MKRLSIGAIALVIFVAGCSKASDAPAVEVAASSKPSPSIAPVPSASSAPSGSKWSGRYAATPGTFSVPDGGEWAGVKFRGEDASVGLGEGALLVSVDPAGHATGTLDGPLGPLRVTGELTESTFSAALVSSEPASGFSGTAVGTRAGEKLAGTMRLSLPTGNVLREGSFALTLEKAH
jgi:hypothetical protein